jgi:hypothetical protein
VPSEEELDAMFEVASEDAFRNKTIINFYYENFCSRLKPITLDQWKQIREALDRMPDCTNCMDSSYRVRAVALMDSIEGDTK